MLIGMLGISVVVGMTATLLLALNGYGLTAAFIYGYVGGGIVSMVVLALWRALRDLMSERQERRRARLTTRAAGHNREGP